VKIRREQMQAINDERVLAKMQELLCEHGPPSASELDSRELRAKIQRGMRGAGSHGISELYDVYRFVEWQLRLGEGFGESNAWAAEILAFEAFDGTEKMNRIDYHAQHVLGLVAEG